MGCRRRLLQSSGRTSLHSPQCRNAGKKYLTRCELCGLSWRPGANTCGAVGVSLRVQLTKTCATYTCRYENLVQVRCLLDGTDPRDILANWHQLLPACMQRWGLHRSEVWRSPCILGMTSLACACADDADLHHTLWHSWCSALGQRGTAGLLGISLAGLQPMAYMRACQRSCSSCAPLMSSTL